MIKNTLNLIIVCITINVHATMVLPYNDLGQLTEIADDIVIVEVKKDLFQVSSELSNYSWELEIKKSFKGAFQPKQIFSVSAYGGKSESNYHHILGDINLEVGKIYLLFLEHTDSDTWIPVCLSFYIYQLEELGNIEHWVPTIDAINMCMWHDSNPLFVLKKIEMEKQLSRYVNNNYASTWIDKKVKSSAELTHFHPSLRTPPSSCAFLFDGSDCYGADFDGVRWQAFPDDPVEVWVDTEQQTGIDSEQLCENAVNTIGNQYEGVYLPFEGILSSNYVPNCANNSALDGNFLSFSSGINGGENILTIFNDPCGQIPDLNNCSGILAIGGSFGWCYPPGNSNNDNYDNLNWMQASNGYIVVNNGAECISDSDFEIMITHEYTHALGLGHIASGNGTANMNPSCCNSITSLDKECVDYLYPATITLPVSWSDFTVEEKISHNLLKWSTASEINNDHFIIEYSKASFDLKIWKELGSIKATGNSSTISEYEFSDDTNLGAQTYYRIKQVDINGQSSYSDIISIQRKIERNEINLFPNPAKDLLNIVGDIEDASILIMDGLGKVVNSTIISATEHLTRIDISMLQNGVYYLKVGNEQDHSVHTFIKH